MKYCPNCRATLVMKNLDDRDRLHCEDACGFVHWANPTPVVAAIVEYENKVLLARNAQWPENWFALVTGFLEAAETPQQAVIREVKEELNLDGEIESFVGNYAFHQANQLLLVYHVRTSGVIALNEELVEYKLLDREDVVPWDMGTGPALKDWLAGRVNY
jgi:NADH pyrophosphatase NudC (nudix superfamily)